MPASAVRVADVRRIPGPDEGIRPQDAAGHVALQCNLTTKNEPLREFFNERNVRIALSLAVDRENMNELAYDGFYTPRQYSPMEFKQPGSCSRSMCGFR